MEIIVRRIVYIAIFFFLTGVFFVQKADAASLTNVSDTITTSRPSAASPLTVDQAANATQATVVDNGSIYLASDSATFLPSTGETINAGVNVASMSAQISGPPNTRIVYFTGVVSNAHHNGDVVLVPITAVHTVRFTTISSIPSGGKIIITFPGSGQNTASPSASTFSFNNLAAAGVTFSGTAVCATGQLTVTAPTITCTTSGPISGSTAITVAIGSVPTLINPTKTVAAGTADLWKIAVTTQDASSITLDSAKTTIGTIESVQVQATVDPTLTFTIAPVSGAINTGNTTGCTNTEAVNSGISSTATTVNLGILNTSTINISAQLITISTNASAGYSLTATSSGHLINPASGVWIPDSTTPGFMTLNVPWFGIHPCGLNVATGTWGSGATGGGANAKYGWPTQTTSVTLASTSTGPIGNTATTGGVGAGLTSVEYAGAVDVSIPAGTYYSEITYVATATF